MKIPPLKKKHEKIFMPTCIFFKKSCIIATNIPVMPMCVFRAAQIDGFFFLKNQ